MEKEKRRKKLDGRVDAETIINELMEGVDLDKAAHEDAESKLHRYETNFSLCIILCSVLHHFGLMLWESKTGLEFVIFYLG